ncbi:hypothetical protein OG800_03280 [Streptomyces sp. NBC_00445]
MLEQDSVRDRPETQLQLGLVEGLGAQENLDDVVALYCFAASSVDASA